MNDIAALLPQQITVVYPAIGAGAPTSGFYPVTTTLSYLATTLGVAQFRGVVGAPWTKTLHRLETASFSGSSTPNNDGLLSNLAVQFSQDWYTWQLARLDQQYAGVLQWTPEGMHDLEFRQRGPLITRIQRGPFNPLEDLIGSALRARPGGGGGGNGFKCGDGGLFSFVEDERCEGGTHGILYKFIRSASLLYDDNGCLQINLGGLSKQAVGCMDCTCVSSGSGPTGGTGTGPTGTGGTKVCTGVPCQWCNPASTPTGFNMTAAGFAGCNDNPPSGIKTPCYANPIPLTVTITFTGSLASFGSVVFTYDANAGAWFATFSTSACGTINCLWQCNGTFFQLLIASSTGVLSASAQGTISGTTWTASSGQVGAVGACAVAIGGYSPFRGTFAATADVSGGASAPGSPNGSWQLTQQTDPCTWSQLATNTGILAELTLEEDAVADDLIFIFRFIDVRSGHHAVLVEYRYTITGLLVDCGRTITLQLSLPNYCTSAPATLTFTPRFDCPSGTGGGGGGGGSTCRTNKSDLCITFSGALAPLGTVRAVFIGGGAIDTYETGSITACGTTGSISFYCANGQYQIASANFISSTTGYKSPDSVSPFQWTLPNVPGNISNAGGCVGTFGCVVTECP